MTASDVFATISAHQVEGMMLHNDMADYFDFLGLMGFKRIHEYQFLMEASEMRGIHRYFINHYNMLLDNKSVSASSYIPAAWKSYTRQEVEPTAKKNAVKMCTERWVEWERETKKLYESMYSNLCSIGEIASALKVKDLLCKVDCELKRADRLHIKLCSIGYDMPSVFYMQDELHEEYKQKTKEIGVDIC